MGLFGESNVFPYLDRRAWTTHRLTLLGDHRHGIYPLRAFTSGTAHILAKATNAYWNGQELETVVFLDVETTGLEIEQGAIVFLIGLARFDAEGNLHLWQHFLVDPQQEEAYLKALHDLTWGANALLTFNGRAFDVAALGYRFARCGLANPLANLAHIDLLTAARRLWRGILPSCSLANLETTLLGIYRWDDLDSWRIPSAYREWLRSGDDEVLSSILQHNRADILSMVTLSVHIANLLVEPTTYARFSEEIVKVARYWERVGDLERAVRLYEVASSGEGSYRQYGVVLARLARIHASHGARDRALQVWTSLTASHWPHPEPYLELARELEGQDADAALHHATQALSLATTLGMNRYIRRAQALIKRLHRYRRST